MSDTNSDAAERARQSAELHASIDASSRTSPEADQFMAGFQEARRLAPPENSVLRLNPNIQACIRTALSSLDRDIEVQGTVPVIRLRALFAEDGSAEHTRHGSDPITDSLPVRYCNACHKSTGRTVPFWLACGPNVVQIDMCGGCADRYILEEMAVPQ